MQNLNVIISYSKTQFLLKVGQITDNSFLVLKGCISVFLTLMVKKKEDFTKQAEKFVIIFDAAGKFNKKTI